MNMVWSILISSGHSRCFLSEAVNWSINIMNRCPKFAVKNMTMEEAWSGKQPTVNHFKIFGFIVYARIPYQKRMKLDDEMHSS